MEKIYVLLCMKITFLMPLIIIKESCTYTTSVPSDNISNLVQHLIPAFDTMVKGNHYP